MAIPFGKQEMGQGYNSNTHEFLGTALNIIPELNAVQYSRYLEATGTDQSGVPEDIARYAAFVMGADLWSSGRIRF